ncbi:MAG TPA: SPOR domain-containing protein [Candidatus Dormibacteraeota bacterium]|nr:SPOR domain-containing protein [Candidatus Dormibacteraeota bacterium]
MAERRERRSAGLSFGQLITLTFGFLLASLFIFVFGFWVGHDLADQRALHQRQPLRVPLDAAPTPLALAAASPPPAAPAVVPPTAVPARAALVFTATPIRPPATPTEELERATPTRRPAAITPTVSGGSWTVQAYATNDTVRAIMLARTLRAKGYDASTGTKQVGDVTWYTVKVGRFRDRTAAKAMESKLRDAEGLEAASVVSQ